MFYKKLIKFIWLKALNCVNDLTEHMFSGENLNCSSPPEVNENAIRSMMLCVMLSCAISIVALLAGIESSRFCLLVFGCHMNHSQRISPELQTAED